MSNTNARLFVAENVGRGLLTSLALESALFAVAGHEAVLGSWAAIRATDDRFIGAFGE